MGIQTADVNAPIEHLQAAMRREHGGFFRTESVSCQADADEAHNRETMKVRYAAV
jgi:hypothetical protein